MSASEHSARASAVSASTKSQQQQQQQVRKKDEASGAQADEAPLLVTVVQGGSEFGNKFTLLEFHPSLPWVLTVTKHGGKIVIWDSEAEKLVSTISVFDALTFQRPHQTATNGIWTESQTGRMISVTFLDDSALLWNGYSGVSVLQRATSGGAGSAGMVDVFSPSGPSEEFSSASESTGHRRTLSAGGVSANARSRVTDDADGGKGNDAAVLLVTEAVACILLVGTTAVQHALSSHQVNNKQFTTAKVVSVVSTRRPLCLMGCNDGCIVVWDPYARDGRCAAVIMTPHSSRITALEALYVIHGNPQAASDSDRVKIEGSSSLCGGHLCIAIGTDGGSVTKLRFRNRDEVDVDFAAKKVHDSVMSLCVTPQCETERRRTFEGLRNGAAESQVQDMINAITRTRAICSLGSQHLVIQDAVTGTELRRIKVKGLGLTRLLPCPKRLLLVGAEGLHYAIDWCLTADSQIQPVADLIAFLRRSRDTQKLTRFVPAAFYDAITLSPLDAAAALVAAAQKPDDDKDLRTYCGVVHPARHGSVFGLGTNKGIFIVDERHKKGTSSLWYCTPVGDGASESASVSLSLNPTLDTMLPVAKTASRPLFTSTFLQSTPDGRLNSFSFVSDSAMLCNLRRSSVVLPLARQVLGLSAVPGSVLYAPQPFAADSSGDFSSISEQRTVFDSTGGNKVAGVWPSPCNELLVVTTTLREILLFEVRRGFAPLTVPTMNRADSVAWAFNSSAFASLAADTRRVVVASVRKVQQHGSAGPDGGPRFQVAPTTHEISPTNVPVAISGGRWLCVHYESSFSGLSSQFFRWESGGSGGGGGAMGGGGAIGNAIPQPVMMRWDPTGTLCALAYETSISFMQVRRKMFSFMGSVDISSAPVDMLFFNKCLFVSFERVIMLLLPTSKMVQKVLIASSDPTIAGGEGASTSSHASAMLSYRVLLAPLGRLRLLRVVETLVDDQNGLALLVADESSLVHAIPLSACVAQLMIYVHGYNFDTCTASQRELVDSCLTAKSDGSGMFAASVRQFALDCGFDAGAQGGASRGSTAAASPLEYAIIKDDVELLVSAMNSGVQRDDPSVITIRRRVIDSLVVAVGARHTGNWVTQQAAGQESIAFLAVLARSMEKRRDAGPVDAARHHVVNDLLFEAFVRLS